MRSTAATVEQYLASLPPDRCAAISAVREVILKNLDKDYAEGIQYGMIGYYVPHSVFPAGYHCDPKQPLNFAGIGSQKSHMAIYLMCVYMHAPLRQWFEKTWKATGKKLDMGKACIRFKKLDDVALDVLGEAIRRVPAADYIKNYTKLLDGARKAGDGKAATNKKSTAAKKNSTTKTAKKKTAGRTKKVARTK